MLYALFLVIAVLYNWRKFGRERSSFLLSLKDAKNISHREMILSHHFYVFIFECFLAFIVAHFITERAFAIGLIGLGFVYLGLLFVGYFLFQYFIRHLEKETSLTLVDSFRKHIVQELRVSFALILLPIFMYSVINWAFQGSVQEEWGSLWFIGLVFNIMFVSVLTIAITVIIMLKLIPNREITESEYQEIISLRLKQIGMPNLRVRWIETDVKNAFVVGLKLFRFSNQTMFLGRSLREVLTLEEFDAVVAHELSHVANRHIHKRVIDLIKNLLSVLLGVGFIMFMSIGLTFLVWGEDASLHTGSTTIFTVLACLSWMIFNYALLFDTIRSHEYEADAFAVINLGASFEAMKTALVKLSTPEEMPDYLKAKKGQNKNQGMVAKFFKKTFSTHPSLEERMGSLEHKILYQLPYSHYVSTAKRIRGHLSLMLNWRVLTPATAVFVLFLSYGVMNYRQGQREIRFITEASTSEIMKRSDLALKINQRPSIIGPSLMYYIVKKKDKSLIDHFVNLGANKGRTLVYVSGLKEIDLLTHYFEAFKKDLSQSEYFLVLRKTAQVDFIEGYRLMVNAEQFENLEGTYKDDIAKLHSKDGSNRRPASIKSK